jgi:ElaA protein
MVEGMMLCTARFDELDAATLYAILRLRSDIFVVEQQAAYEELDGRDTESATIHRWLEDDGVIVAYLRVLRDATEFRIGRVCTARTHRGAGLAAELMEAALEAVDGIDAATTCVLDAQTRAMGLYERFGFTVSGDRYVEDGIEHVPMRRGAPTLSRP